MNVNGMNEKVKRTQIFRYLRQQEVDIACLQETYASRNKHRIYKSEWGGRIIFNDGKSNSRGVAILIRKGIEFQINSIDKDNDGRILNISGSIGQQTLRIVNVYAPNEDKPEFFVEIIEKLNICNDDHVIILGNLNQSLTILDKKGGKFKESKSAEIINTFLEESGWVDAWRTLNDSKFQYTWKRKKPLTMSRLDYFLIPLGTLYQVENCEILASYLSDHCPILLKLSFDENIRGPGYWKLNTRHLTNRGRGNKQSFRLCTVPLL